jgi:glycosyltransferase involved in cell wall biosynthesis
LEEPLLSIIIPTYFRDPYADGLPALFEDFFEHLSAQREDRFEVFISDSGPAEHEGIVNDTLQTALQKQSWLQDKVHYHYETTTDKPLSRAAAMNLGVAHTDGEYLLFLHIDCRLPPGGLARLRQAFRRGALGGGFLKQYIHKQEEWSPLLVTEQYLNWLRTWQSRHLVGTNGIFLHRSIAEEHPYHGEFLEDVELSDWLRVRLQGDEWQLLTTPMRVSARKYYKQGVWPSLAINASVMALYRVFHRPPTLLKQELYHQPFPKGWRFWPAWAKAVFHVAKHRSK